MEWMGLNEVREEFLAFFEGKGHQRLPSAPLVPGEDASLLLINSGMAPLKKYFLGLEAPPSKRVTTCQKCIRTPDIERVGKTSRHGTFFEMLGNFSFGDYFKEDATKWAWEFITQVLKIPVDRVWVSVYEEDDEAARIWVENRGVDPGRIVRLGKDDNFWEIGSGPCGPCSEVYFDRGEEHGCGSPDCAVGCDCDRYVEFWNLVFTQFNSDGAGNYTPLEHPNIDTGMGLERLACILQGVDNLFEVDTVQKIMKHIASIAGVEYKRDERTDVSLRVVTDHIRSTVFMVGDGVIPQNEGRGYVLRRLLRRAARHGRLLGIKGSFLADVCDTVIEENKTAYPQLLENADYIKKVIRIEEERFTKTIEQGLEMLWSLMERAEAKMINGERAIDGADAFRLYDTFGFPLDLTKEIAADRNFIVDEEGFLSHMQAQRARARKARESQGDLGWEEDVLAGSDFTDTFVGYAQLKSTGKVLHIVRDGAEADSISQGEQAAVFLDITPFYAESGGQVGDTGFINIGKSIFRVTGCKKSPTGHFMHIGVVESGFISVGDEVTAVVDKQRRQSITRNHTAAHLLQAALRQVLGTHVHQAGQMVDQHVCRFDFTHFSAVNQEQLDLVEKKVNDMILEALPLELREMPMDEAKKLGALALFSDKYSDVVRVCNISGKSVELCGGTHVTNTASLGLFKILHETSVAAGVRRIEATTGRGVLELIGRQNQTLQQACEVFKLSSPAELPAKCAAAAAQLKEQQQQLDDLNEKLTAMRLGDIANALPRVGVVQVLATALPDATPEALRAAADKIKDKYSDIAGLIAGIGGEKITLFAFAGKDAVKAGVHSGKLVQAAAKAAGGSGGGRPDNAMGGIPGTEGLEKVLDAVPGIIKEQLGI